MRGTGDWGGARSQGRAPLGLGLLVCAQGLELGGGGSLTLKNHPPPRRVSTAACIITSWLPLP
jgi:hypothetical protein